MFRSKHILAAFFLLLILIAFTGCKDDPSSSLPPTGFYQLEKPKNFPLISFNYDFTKSEFSVDLHWNASPGEDDENFSGYAVITYAADFGDSINPSYVVIDSAFLPGNAHHVYTVDSVERDKRFYSAIYTVSFGAILSEPLKTSVYSTKTLAPPQNVRVEMNFDNGYPEALVSWDPSPDENLKDLTAYEALTYQVTKDGEKRYSPGEGGAFGKKRSIKVKLRYKGAYYRTYIRSLHANGYYVSQTEAASCIYGYEILDSGQVDEMSLAREAKSAYGWNNSGAGSQYVFNSANANSIDICCVKEDSLFILSSPAAVQNAPAGARQTKFLKLGADYWETVAAIPADPIYNKTAVSEGDVILLKTQDDYYIKLKIKKISAAGSSPYSTIAFDYRFQTMQGLRAAKQ